MKEVMIQAQSNRLTLIDQRPVTVITVTDSTLSLLATEQTSLDHVVGGVSHNVSCVSALVSNQVKSSLHQARMSASLMRLSLVGTAARASMIRY